MDRKVRHVLFKIQKTESLNKKKISEKSISQRYFKQKTFFDRCIFFCFVS